MILYEKKKQNSGPDKTAARALDVNSNSSWMLKDGFDWYWLMFSKGLDKISTDFVQNSSMSQSSQKVQENWDVPLDRLITARDNYMALNSLVNILIVSRNLKIEF